VNDVIIFYPKLVRDSVISYAKKQGIDWLRASQSLLENMDLRRALEEKHEALMRLTESLVEKEEVLMRLTESLVEKEAVIQELNAALEACRSSLVNLDKGSFR
jgi:predicted nuclease with TOPRIM domain